MKYLTLIVIALASCALDARAEWELVSGTEQMGNVYTLKTDGRRLYAGAKNGVYISLDKGDTWHSTNLNHPVYEMAISHDAVYAYAGRIHGLYRSDNHGHNWNPKNDGIPQRTRDWLDDDGQVVHVYHDTEQILVTRSGTVIAVGDTDGTYMSKNRGESWHDVFDEWVYRHRFGDYNFGRDIWSMTEFDGYLWVATGPPSCFVPLITATRGIM